LTKSQKTSAGRSIKVSVKLNDDAYLRYLK